jgi:hypothetical protein
MKLSIKTLTPEDIYGRPVPGAPEGHEIVGFRLVLGDDLYLSSNGKDVLRHRSAAELHGPRFILRRLPEPPTFKVGDKVRLCSGALEVGTVVALVKDSYLRDGISVRWAKQAYPYIAEDLTLLASRPTEVPAGFELTDEWRLPTRGEKWLFGDIVMTASGDHSDEDIPRWILRRILPEPPTFKVGDKVRHKTVETGIGTIIGFGNFYGGDKDTHARVQWDKFPDYSLDPKINLILLASSPTEVPAPATGPPNRWIIEVECEGEPTAWLSPPATVISCRKVVEC